MISAIALCSLSTPSFCLGEKLLGAKIQNAFTWGAPDDVAKNPKQSAAYLDSLNEKVEELRTKYQTFMSTDELTATIRGNQTKTKKHIERKKKWNETTAVYGLRNARLTTEQPELIDAIKLIAEGEKQEKTLRTRSKKLGLKPGLKKAEDKIEDFKKRLEKANIADTTMGATSALTAQQIQDKVVLLRKELEEAFKYNRTVATDILGFNLTAKIEGADTLYFSPVSSKDEAWIKKIQEQATSFFNKVKGNAEDKKKLLDESEIRLMYKNLWDNQKSGAPIDLQEPTAVYARLASADGPLCGDLPNNISDISTTYNEIDFETRLSTAVVDSMAGQCALLKKNQPASSKQSDAEATSSAVPLIISSGWLNNVQTYIAGYQDVAVLAGLGIYSARGAVQDIQKQVEAAIAKLNSYLQITEDAISTADNLGTGEGDSSTTDSAKEKAASTKAAREATVEKVHTAFSNLTADKKKSVKELCQTIETTLRALHNQYQRLLNGNRIIALKAVIDVSSTALVVYKEKNRNATARLGSTETTTARTEFKAAKTKLYDLLAMIQAVRSGSFTPDDKKAIVERPKTLANLFFIMDQKDADEEFELQETAALDAATKDYADATITRHELEKQGGTTEIQKTEGQIQARERDQQQRIRTGKLVATQQQLGDITALVKETQAVMNQAADAGAPAEATKALERIEWSDNPLGGSTAETLRQTEQTVTALANASEALTKAAAKPNVTPAKRKILEGLIRKFTRLGEQWRAWRYSRMQPKESISWTHSPSQRLSDEPNLDKSSPSSTDSRPVRPQRVASDEQEGVELLPAAYEKEKGPASGRSLPAEVEKDISRWQRLLKRMNRNKTADELATSTPARIQTLAKQTIAKPDADGDGEVSSLEQESTEAAKGILARLRKWWKSLTGDAKKPAGKGYMYELTTDGEYLGNEHDQIRRFRTDIEITELWYQSKSNFFIVKLKQPQASETGKGTSIIYRSMKMIDDAPEDKDCIMLVQDKDAMVASTAFITQGMKKLEIQKLVETTTGDPSEDTGDPSISTLRDSKDPKTEKKEGIYRLTTPLAIQVNSTTKNLATFRIRDGWHNEITNIQNIWLQDSDASLTVYTQNSDGYTKKSVEKNTIEPNGELSIVVPATVTYRYTTINDQDLVYPTINSYWEQTGTVISIADDIHDASGAAEGTSPDPLITFPQDIPLVILNPRTSNLETKYFKHLTCISSDGNYVEPSEITSIDISTNTPDTSPSSYQELKHIAITIFFTDDTIYQQNIKTSNLETSSATLRINLGDQRQANTSRRISSRQHRVYPNLGTNWQTKLTPEKTRRTPKDGPAAGRSGDQDPAHTDPQRRAGSGQVGSAGVYAGTDADGVYKE